MALGQLGRNTPALLSTPLLQILGRAFGLDDVNAALSVGNGRLIDDKQQAKHQRGLP